MIDSASFQGLHLGGGFVLQRLEFVREPFTDALGRPALAMTRVVGANLYVKILSDLSDEEQSVTLYHEILEALTIAYDDVPDLVKDFNEGAFEAAAYQAHARFGPVSPAGLSAMLQFFGFRQE